MKLDSRDLVDIIKNPVVTEKATRLMELNQYTFDVDVRLTKTKIKALIEEVFQVKVLSVNTHRCPRKKKRLGQYQGYKPRNKRVIITLRPEDSIPLFPEE